MQCIPNEGYTAFFLLLLILMFVPMGDGSDGCGATLIPFRQNQGRYTIIVRFNDHGAFFWAQGFAAEWGGLLHGVWNLCSVDDMKY